MNDVRGMTIALNAGESAAVLDFYTRVFDHAPDTAPMDNFLEWQICPGAWLQLSTGHERPGANNARVRVEVDDVEGAVARMTEIGVPVGEIVTVPEVVAFANFSDHWGNALGFFQLLSPRSIITEAQRRRDAQERADEAALADSTGVDGTGSSGTGSRGNGSGGSSSAQPDSFRGYDVTREQSTYEHGLDDLFPRRP